MDVTVQDGLVGRTVDDRYLVESRIAEGGMATVYLAVDRRLDREVALKVMHTDLSDDQEYASRFVREARAAARLSHPNIVQVFDQGADRSEAGRDLLYLAMEYLPGRTLRDVLAERGSLTPRETASVMVPLLDALGAAHRGGIVHRDVKPENIILTDDGRVKVADFGLAKAITVPVTGESRGQLYGTAAYLAPELVSRGIADHRADLYAAGIVLFELLTGAQPFTGEDPVQVAHMHVHEDVPAPSVVAPALPPDFDALTLSATAHDPDRRPATADDMLGQVRQVRAAVPESALDVRAALPVPGAAGRTDPTRALSPATGAVAGAAVGAAAGAVTGAAVGAAAGAGASEAATAVHPTIPAPDATQAYPASAGYEPPGPQGYPAPAYPTQSYPPPGPNGGPPPLPRLSVHEDEPALVTLGPAGRPPRSPEDERRRKILVGAAGGAALVLILGLFWWFSGGPGSTVPAPSLVGLTRSAAEAELAKAGLSAKVEEAFDDTVKKNSVVSSDPAAGEGVDKGGTVTIVLSKGPQSIAMPDVVGKPWSEVKPQLEDEYGLTKVTGKTVFSSKVDKGDVISTDPKAGATVALGAAVVVSVSRGPEPVTLPNVVGQNIAQAKAQLNGLGIKVKQQVQPFDGTQLPGTVVAQSTPEGGTLGKGEAITLTVVDPNGQIQVPDVRGWTFKDAQKQLSDLGFNVERVGGGFFGGDDDDTVVNQSPNPGEMKRRGEIVYLQTQGN